ncbi:MAG: acylphosphatase [Candidatus Coatesbacteria bacterium]|nr:acylphosphatase [Candidatus Coatesbacteria bacterium]
MSALTARIHGRVQGVGFRYFVLRHARSLGLTGTVANLPDGSVRVVVEGGRDELQQLLRLLKRGPATAAVDKVDVQWTPPTKRYRDFTVDY